MEIGKVYEVIPMFQVTINNLHHGDRSFYGRFIGCDSSGKYVFEQDGKYSGYWDAGTRDSIFDTAKIVPLHDKSGTPSCYLSNPPYQAQAENGCEDCAFSERCLS